MNCLTQKVRYHLASILLTFIAFAWAPLMAQEPNESYRTPVAQVLEINIYTGDPNEMKHLIVTRLLDHYVEEQGLEVDVTASEVTEYIVNLERAAAQQLKQRENRRRGIISQLESKELTDLERENLMDELNSLYLVLENRRENGPGAAPDIEATNPARTDLVRAVIHQWKINKALYLQYGGRVIYQQNGLVPLDAYREYLQEQEESGKFTILNKEYKEQFWSYFKTDAMHTFYDTGSKDPFSEPWLINGELNESQ